jgi:phosphomannomutase
LSGDEGLLEIREMIAGNALPPPAARRGQVTTKDVLEEYVTHVMSFIDPSIIKPFNVVLDAGNGIGGMVAPLLFRRLPCRTTGLCMEVDGTFPNHEANPLIEENRRDIVERVKAEKADIGIAWDGDADRVFFIDGTGEFVAGDFVTALLAEAFLIKHPGAKVVYDVRASYSVKDIVARYGGTALMNRVGHAFIKRRMREENAIFGGEVTGHYYFRDFYYADNGFIPALLILELMSKKGQSLHELLKPLSTKYFISGEINTKLKSMDLVPAKLREIAEHPEAFKIDPRADLYLRYLRYVDALKPLAIMMENVPDIMNYGGSVIPDPTAFSRSSGIMAAIMRSTSPDGLSSGWARTTSGRPLVALATERVGSERVEQALAAHAARVEYDTARR